MNTWLAGLEVSALFLLQFLAASCPTCHTCTSFSADRSQRKHKKGGKGRVKGRKKSVGGPVVGGGSYMRSLSFSFSEKEVQQVVF